MSGLQALACSPDTTPADLLFNKSATRLAYLLVTVMKAITYLFTPWSIVFLEKLICFQLVKKFPAFYGIRRFITALTSAR